MVEREKEKEKEKEKERERETAGGWAVCQSPSELSELKRAPTLPHIQPAPPPHPPPAASFLND